MVEFILQNTVNSDNKIVRMPDYQSRIPLQCAVAKGQVSVVELLVSFTDTIKCKTIDKQTALHLSCIHHCDKIVDLISEDSIQILLTRLNNIETPPLQYAILKKNYSAAEILLGKGAKLDFLKEGKRRLCDDSDKLKLKVVEYESQCWVGFEIQIAKESHFVITQLPSLEGDTYVSADESHNIKPYNKETIKDVMRHICECESSDPFNNLFQNGLISPEGNFPQIAKFATKEVIRTFLIATKMLSIINPQVNL